MGRPIPMFDFYTAPELAGFYVDSVFTRQIFEIP